MSRTFFAAELDTAASWWRIHRRDGVTLGFTTHDRDLWFGGVLHRAAPGMLPSAIRRTIELGDDEAEVEGALGHDTIRAEDLAAGRFDGARIESGVVDWASLEHAGLYSGSIAGVSQDAGGFSARLQSAKADLGVDPVPRASPSCRARFCGPGCGLSADRFTRRVTATEVDLDANTVTFDLPDPEPFLLGEMRWLDGPQTGLPMRAIARRGAALEFDETLDAGCAVGHRALLREGCDHTIATCAARFGNAINFRGEPDLPGNDLLTRYPQPR
ncbi:DUF2163 domain-containing protein [Erythrobacter sp. SD-21]|uniref:DUF2163 domain-containing protein n=1 Tax=Erythrobacter sp. SD-21 TaxID=161528 RepID=UPI000153F773|nr:DUF2163 domain-containing protein [Erythrobacter sp. SD-21]EDL49049.1 hypothetical protein ED21_20254 [Erythrobacter sp. SD-21]